MPWWRRSPAEEIALHTGVSATTVHRVIAKYNRLGPAAIGRSAKGGRHHEYLTFEQEQAFLQPFFARAQRGEIATVEQIHQAFEEEVKHEVHSNSIYRLLHRHGWRKLAPRSRHPKANQEEQEAFQKKTSSKRSTRRSLPERPLMSARCSRWPKTKAALGASASPDAPGLPPFMRPEAVREIVRDYTYVYAAVAPASGQMTSLILPSADTEMMALFLEHVSASFAKYFVVMQVDPRELAYEQRAQDPRKYSAHGSAGLQSRARVPSNMCGKNCAKNSLRIWLLHPLMRSLTRCVKDSTSLRLTLSVCVL